MKPGVNAVARSASAKPHIEATAANYLNQLWGVAEAEIEKLVHDPLELLTRAVQPLLWLLLFGQVMARVRGINTGTVTYEDFLAPGILAQSVLFAAIFYGIAAIWERDLGVLQRYLVSPAPRSALVSGCEPRPTQCPWRRLYRARLRLLFDLLANHRLYRQDA